MKKLCFKKVWNDYWLGHASSVNFYNSDPKSRMTRVLLKEDYYSDPWSSSFGNDAILSRNKRVATCGKNIYESSIEGILEICYFGTFPVEF